MNPQGSTSRFRFPPPSGGGPETRVYLVPSDQIGYITNIVEAYDGIGLVRTLDRKRGIVEMWVMPDWADSFDNLLAALQKEFPIQRLEGALD